MSKEKKPIGEPEDRSQYVEESILRARDPSQYEVTRLVARGGMGVVYRAKDLNFGRNVAVKLLADAEVRNSEHQSFLDEARITSFLEHPNIIPVHDLGSDAKGNAYYTMKYVSGVTLTDILTAIKDGRRSAIEEYPLPKLLTIFQKTCDAVAFAHSRGVLHCDIKPGNVMIGDYGEVLVLDWGLARSKGSEKEWRATRPGISRETTADDFETCYIHADNFGTDLKTRDGGIVGTPSYMSPEQIQNLAEIDERSDIYSLGATLYTILALRVSVTGSNVHDVLKKIVEGDIIAPAAATEDIALPHCQSGNIPPVLSEIVMKAMSVAPADRYQSIKDLQTEVEAYQSGVIWHPIINEHFLDDGVFERWDAVGGKCEVGNGELRMSGGEPQLLVLKRDLPGDVRIDFDCRIEGDYLNDLGCFIGGIRSDDPAQIPKTGYEIKYGTYDNSRNVVERYGQIIWEDVESPLMVGKEFRVRVERVGSMVRLSVNDAEVCNVTDLDPITGPDHVVVGLLGWMSKMVFSRIRVYTLGAPWKSDILEVAERHLARAHYRTALDLFQEVMDSYPDGERLQRASIGHRAASHCLKIDEQLIVWRSKLRDAWGDVPFNLRIESGELTLEMPNLGIEDLSPLVGMPITQLNCSGNKVTDLEPLRNMPLEFLSCGWNPIASLEPLHDTSLTALYCESCGLTTLKSLQGMILLQLSCAYNKLEDGLSPLEGMPLTWLSCVGCDLDSLAPLKGMPLNDLNCDANRIESLEPLKGMRLGSLTCSGNAIASLEPLRDMPLRSLHCGMNKVESLDPLRGLPLSMLSCQCNRIRLLDPLQNAALSVLMCGDNPIASLGPFAGKPPKSFLFENGKLPTKELELLAEKWRRDFRFAEHARNVEILLAARAADANKLKSFASTLGSSRCLLIPKFLSWEDANAFCEAVGGHLLALTSKEKNDMVASLFPTGGWFWMGLERSEDGLKWVTGVPVDFTAFVNRARAESIGPKVFHCGAWTHDDIPYAKNCFVVEWDD